jgi:hypothetical protein
MHLDIVFGPEVAIGDVHYALLFSDSYSRMNYVYPLHNLTSDIPKQLQAFFAHLGFMPTRLISDFDLKLIGGKAKEYLNSLLIHVNAAPLSPQDRNGLAERHWQTMLAMAHNWLASVELPFTFGTMLYVERLRSVIISLTGWRMVLLPHHSNWYIR